MVKPMLENTIEKYLKKKVEELGGLCYKFAPSGKNGIPDRIVLHKGKAYFVELKAPNKEPRKIQKIVHQKFEKQGFPVIVIDSKQKVDEFINILC